MEMSNIAIVYFSKSGATRVLAKAIQSGIECALCNATLFEIESRDIEEGRYVNNHLLSSLKHFDAIVFGSPTYMGSASAQFKAFMDASSDEYVQLNWRNKLAAGFTMGGSLNGEQQQTLLGFFALACQHGMIWAGLDVSKHTDNKALNRTGSSIGLVASYYDNKQVHPNDLETAHYFGSRIADLAHQRRHQVMLE
ncbi:flavodoxin family protein [Vibrio mediterranei]|uniref:flavodoxin family protein n=1 Tax=Vibrio mediterranei TaxID=689 RepID=UPI00148DEC5D|nr:flavodoxin family protein [Vibrio mediterranei]